MSSPKRAINYRSTLPQLHDVITPRWKLLLWLACYTYLVHLYLESSGWPSSTTTRQTTVTLQTGWCQINSGSTGLLQFLSPSSRCCCGPCWMNRLRCTRNPWTKWRLNCRICGMNFHDSIGEKKEKGPTVLTSIWGLKYDTVWSTWIEWTKLAWMDWRYIVESKIDKD